MQIRRDFFVMLLVLSLPLAGSFPTAAETHCSRNANRAMDRADELIKPFQAFDVKSAGPNSLCRHGTAYAETVLALQSELQSILSRCEDYFDSGDEIAQEESDDVELTLAFLQSGQKAAEVAKQSCR